MRTFRVRVQNRVRGRVDGQFWGQVSDPNRIADRAWDWVRNRAWSWVQGRVEGRDHPLRESLYAALWEETRP